MSGIELISWIASSLSFFSSREIILVEELRRKLMICFSPILNKMQFLWFSVKSYWLAICARSSSKEVSYPTKCSLTCWFILYQARFSVSSAILSYLQLTGSPSITSSLPTGSDRASIKSSSLPSKTQSLVHCKNSSISTELRFMLTGKILSGLIPSRMLNF